MDNKLTYQSAGVHVEAGYEAVRRMKSSVAATFIPGVLGGLGSFGGMFELPTGYRSPVLVSGTDGVGTKLAVAFRAGVHTTIGIDCVAMCVNDIACQGAKPLFFLDYIGTGILEPQKVSDIVAGVSEGCLQAGCALIGGETAEMPGFYQKGEYDLAGFAVGIVEKDRIINGSDIKQGDVLIGVASSGAHSNGFSLIRKVCFEENALDIHSYIDTLGATLGQTLLTPTKIYVSLIQSLLAAHAPIKGIAHITGGGWVENIPRLFADESYAAVITQKPVPPAIFPFLQSLCPIDMDEMYKTFNMGIGLVLAVAKDAAEDTMKQISELGESCCLLGYVEKRTGKDGIRFA